MTCAEVDDSAPGYALDILDPGRRSLVASHLLRCGRCRETVSRTQASADQLLDVDGAAAADRFSWPDPSPDDWLGDEEGLSNRRPKRPLRVAATMAAVLVLLVGTTVGPELEQAGAPAPVPTLAVPLMAGLDAVGSVRVFDGHPPVMQITVTGIPGRPVVQVELADGRGRIESLGQFRLTPGSTAWATPEPRDMPAPNSLVLAGADGTVLARAALS